MFASVIVFCLWASFALGAVLPPVLADMANTEPGKIDEGKLYEPNPPVTNNVLMVVEYFDEEQQKPVEHELIIDLYGTVVPLTVNNFVTLAKGVRIHYEGTPEGQSELISFKDSVFHRIVPDKLIEGGDVLREHIPFSVYGGNWPVENFDLKHDRPGRLSMANDGPNAQNSQFFITTGLEPETELDGNNVVFGQVVAGLEKLIEKIQKVPINSDGEPIHEIKLKYSVGYDLSLADRDAMHDAYLKKLEDYRNGELNKGVTMALTFAGGREEEKELADIKFNDLHHPLGKVFIGIVVLLIAYVVVRSKKASKLIKRRI